jgi:trans-aconitate 2-methyltransferase
MLAMKSPSVSDRSSGRLSGRFLQEDGGLTGFGDWDPDQYARFSGVRSRPARELIARIPGSDMRTIIDLGCGDGPVTRLLLDRWPNAMVTGVDSSQAMLDRARKLCPEVDFIEADIAIWSPNRPVDLIFSNAALQWVDNHAIRVGQLFAHISRGGALAVQMPGNFDAPSHRALAALAKSAEWFTKVGPLVRPNPVAAPSAYLDWLGEIPAAFDAWETTDFLILEGEDPVLEWMKGTALRPYLGVLTQAEAARFMKQLASRLRDAYPPRADGRTVLPFRRIYFVATRK